MEATDKRDAYVEVITTVDSNGNKPAGASGSEKFETAEKFDDEAKVLYTFSESEDEIQSVVLAEEATGTRLPLKGTVLISVSDRDKPEALQVARAFKQLGFELLATGGTYEMLKKNGVEAEKVKKIYEGSPNIADLIGEKKIDLIINTPIGKQSAHDDSYIRKAAIKNRICYMTTMAAAQASVQGIRAVLEKGMESVRSLQEYQANP